VIALPRTLARLLLAWVFIRSGLDVLRNPEPRVKTASGFLDELRTRVPLVPEDKLLMVRTNAGLMLVAGGLLALGVQPLSRLAALALCVSLVPTTLGGHAFWTHTDPAARAQQWIHFDKNLAMAGGLLYFALQPSRR
jgi:uncharacterized membrane protein YphA (DoxX/SURF4 family)